MLLFWFTLRLPEPPVFIICSRRSWIFASNCENSAHQTPQNLSFPSSFPSELFSVIYTPGMVISHLLHWKGNVVSYLVSPLYSTRQQLRHDNLEDKKENYQNCYVLYCAMQLCTVICTLKSTDELFLALSFYVLTRASLFALGLVTSIFRFVCYCLVVSTSAIDCLKDLSLKWPIMYQVER